MTKHAAALVAAVLVCSLAIAAAVPAHAHAVLAKGVVDATLEALPTGSPAVPGMIREIDRGLGADWVRITAVWSALEPQPGAYAQTELERLDGLVGGSHDAGLKVMVTVVGTPAWAQD